MTRGRTTAYVWNNRVPCKSSELSCLQDSQFCLFGSGSRKGNIFKVDPGPWNWGASIQISSSGSEAHRAVAEKSKGGKTNKDINNFYNRMGLIREKMLRREVSAYRVGGMEVGPQSFCYWERSRVKES